MGEPTDVVVVENFDVIVYDETPEQGIIITPQETVSVITDDEDVFEVITLGEQGVAGPPGDVGATLLYLPAAEGLLAYRAVKAVGGQFYLADKDTPADQDKIVGLIAGDYTQSENAAAFVTGAIVNPAWSFSDGAVYLGNGGQLTQTLPVSGFVKQIGTVAKSDTLVLNIQDVG